MSRTTPIEELNKQIQSIQELEQCKYHLDIATKKLERKKEKIKLLKSNLNESLRNEEDSGLKNVLLKTQINELKERISNFDLFQEDSEDEKNEIVEILEKDNDEDSDNQNPNQNNQPDPQDKITLNKKLSDLNELDLTLKSRRELIAQVGILKLMLQQLTNIDNSSQVIENLTHEKAKISALLFKKTNQYENLIDKYKKLVKSLKKKKKNLKVVIVENNIENDTELDKNIREVLGPNEVQPGQNPEEPRPRTVWDFFSNLWKK